jgi:hypothetical protein
MERRLPFERSLQLNQEDKRLFKKTLIIAICATLIAASGIRPAYAAEKKNKEDRMAEKVRSGVQKLGVGQDARIELKLRDKTKLAGYVSQSNDDNFTVTDIKTGSSTVVSYPDVTKVQGHNLSTRTKVIIGVAIAVAVAIVLYSVKGAFCDGC